MTKLRAKNPATTPIAATLPVLFPPPFLALESAVIAGLGIAVGFSVGRRVTGNGGGAPAGEVLFGGAGGEIEGGGDVKRLGGGADGSEAGGGANAGGGGEFCGGFATGAGGGESGGGG